MATYGSIARFLEFPRETWSLNQEVKGEDVVSERNQISDVLNIKSEIPLPRKSLL